jgi:hypothetical protein
MFEMTEPSVSVNKGLTLTKEIKKGNIFIPNEGAK